MELKQAVGVVIFNSTGQILLCQRGGGVDSNKGNWENAGGRVEPGETPEQTAIREVKEEVNIDARIEDLELLFSSKSTDDLNRTWEVFIFKLITDQVPTIMEPQKCSQLKWVNKEDLKNMDLAEYAREDYIKLGWIN